MRPPVCCLLQIAVTLLALVPTPPARAQDLLVLSRGSREILEYDGGDGSFVRQLAQAVSEGFRLPGGIAIRPSDGVLYVSSVSTGEVWSYATASGDVITPAVSTTFFAPFGIAFDASGANLYVADASTEESENSDEIKQLAVDTGVVSTLGSDNQADFAGVAVNGSHVFATDVAGDEVKRFAISGGPGTSVISSGLSQPGALIFPTSAQMLVADTGNDRVVEYLESAGSWTFNREVLSAAAGVSEPVGLAIAPDGRLSVSGRRSGDVVLVDLTSLVVSPLVAPGAGGLQDPKGLAWNGNELLVASAAGNAVFYFDDSGAPTGLRAEGLSAPLDAGFDLAADGSSLFVGSIAGNDILEYDVATGARLRIFSQACPNFPFPFDVAVGPDGNLYVSCILNGSIEHFDTTAGIGLGSFVIAGFGGLVSPRNLAFGPNGNLFVSNGTDEILEFDGMTGAPSGPQPFISSSGNGGGAINPYGLRFHDGILYVASFSFDEIKTFDAFTGAFLSTLVTAGSGGLSGPTAIDVGSGGDLFVSSTNDDSIRRYDSATGAFVEVFVASGLAGLDDPFDLVSRPVEVVTVPALPAGAGVLLFAALIAGAIDLRRH